MLDCPFISVPRDPFCNIHFAFKNITFGITVTLTYFVLWFKVFTVFYQNELVRRNVSKVLQIVNKAIMPLFFAAALVMVFRVIIIPQTTFAGCGCKPLASRERFIRQWIGVVASSTAFQFVLLFCFVYPLHLHRKQLLKSGLDDGYIYSVIKRATIAAVFWVFSDLLTFIFGVVYFGLLIYNHYIALTINLLITLNATILSFANWQEKLVPFGKNLQCA